MGGQHGKRLGGKNELKNIFINCVIDHIEFTLLPVFK